MKQMTKREKEITNVIVKFILLKVKWLIAFIFTLVFLIGSIFAFIEYDTKFMIAFGTFTSIIMLILFIFVSYRLFTDTEIYREV